VKEVDLSTVGARIKHIRSHVGLTQEKFGASLGVSKAVIYDLESGRAKPLYNFTAELKEKHNVNMDFFFTGKGNLFNSDLTFNVEKMVMTVDQDIIKQFIYYFHYSPILQLEIIRHFLKYFQHEKEVIEKDIQNILGQEEEKKSNSITF
jgi:transcriptional regulator with XRE-family HTH domain